MSTEVQPVVKVDSLHGPGKRKHKDTTITRRQLISATLKAQKSKTEEATKHFKSTKKRSQSFSGGKIFPPYKKRKKEKLIPPTKFLLGGNIRDPLNLNSFQDEEVNRAMNAVTPESSPLPTPQHRKGVVEVIIPPDINDPLSLAGGEEDDEAYAASFNTSNPHTPKKLKKKNKKRRSKGGSKDEPDGPPLRPDELKLEEVQDGDSSGEIILPEDLNKSKEEDKDEEKKEKEFRKPKLCLNVEKKEKKSVGQELKDKIVSPVIPQPGAWPGGGRFRKQGSRRPNQPKPKFKESGRKFQYGNYNRYYGYRSLGHEADPRLKVFARLRHLFHGKEILDIGCNTGVMSVAIARDFGARSVVGIDIDKNLVSAARRRVRCTTKEFPVSMPSVYGPLDIPGVQKANTFPHNLTFVLGNYVLDNDTLLELEQPQFDVILCLSITKWIHLNWGDDGLKRAFKRMFNQLRPGGVLILEPQDWSSYKRKKNLTETIWENYQNITLFPARFTEYLLSEVGFSKCEVVGSPFHSQKGFQRPIKAFTKGETPPYSRTPRWDVGSLATTPKDEDDTNNDKTVAVEGDASLIVKSGGVDCDNGEVTQTQ